MAVKPPEMGIPEYGKFVSTSLFSGTEGKKGEAYARQFFHNLGSMIETKLIRCEYFLFTEREWIDSDSVYKKLENEIINLTNMISDQKLSISADRLNESGNKVKEMKAVCELLKNNIRIQNVEKLSDELEKLSNAVAYRILDQGVKDLTISMPNLDIRKNNLSEIDYNIQKMKEICKSLINNKKYTNIKELSQKLNAFEKQVHDLAQEKVLKYQEIAKERVVSKPKAPRRKNLTKEMEPEQPVEKASIRDKGDGSIPQLFFITEKGEALTFEGPFTSNQKVQVIKEKIAKQKNWDPDAFHLMCKEGDSYSILLQPEKLIGIYPEITTTNALHIVFVETVEALRKNKRHFDVVLGEKEKLLISPTRAKGPKGQKPPRTLF
jgi:hypothetical protein